MDDQPRCGESCAIVSVILGIIFAFVAVAKGNWSNLLISGIILSWVGVLSSVALLAVTSSWLIHLLYKLHSN